MKVLLVNTYDFGGAANACIRLHTGLLAQGVEAKLLFRQKKNNADLQQSYAYTTSQIQPPTLHRLAAKAGKVLKKMRLAPQHSPAEKEEIRRRQFIKNRPAGLDLFTFPYSNYDITSQKLYAQADVVNLHWVADFVDFKNFFGKNSKPVVWTLHDENPFLGGEHYAERFLGMDAAGKPITRKYTKEETLEAAKITALKKEALRKVDNLHIVAPSKWLYNESKKSEMFGRLPHYHIPYGFPTNIFRPHNQAFARQTLGIPENKTVLLFVAETITNQRKGYAFLQKAFDGLSANFKESLMLCAVGQKTKEASAAGIMEFGKVADERLMALLYSAADVFVIPSLEDNLPNTMIESMLCGTPVIGFPAGGIPNAVVDGITGYLCPEISVEALKNTIEKFLANPAFFSRTHIASSSATLYSLAAQANSYIQLYSQISKKA